MIRHTFCILEGIGEKIERRLWQQGILTWKNFLDAEELCGFTTERKRLLKESLFRFSEALSSESISYLSRNIKRREHWRFYDLFRDKAVCLDIETNGLQPQAGGYVTAVGIYNGFDYRCLVRGNDLTAENIARELDGYKCLITFYGAAFDVPFLMRTFRGLSFDMPHFDLCFAAKRIGMSGGLKALEQTLEISRDDAVRGLNGYDAVKLWEYAQAGSSEALDLLVQYNREDTVNLMKMASIIYGQLRLSTGIEEYLSCGVH